jgi:hypothetical protein
MADRRQLDDLLAYRRSVAPREFYFWALVLLRDIADAVTGMTPETVEQVEEPATVDTSAEPAAFLSGKVADLRDLIASATDAQALTVALKSERQTDRPRRRLIGYLVGRLEELGAM